MRALSTVHALALLAACTSCAVSSNDSATEDESIVGGRAEARFAPVGYLALEQDRTTRSFTPFCTATLIAPRVVATAAHCVHDIKHSIAPAGPWLTFSRGATSAPTRAPVFVSAIYEDPKFDPTDPEYFPRELYQHDFALLVLEAPMAGTTPARIASADLSHDHLAVGYGRTKSGPFDLVEEGLPKRKSLPMALSAESPSTHHLADPAPGGSVCYGDSGGPLLDVSASGDSVIVGVLATMFTNDPNATCMPGTRAAYSSFAAKRAFVDEVLAAVSGGPTTADLVLPADRALPLGRADVLRIGDAREVDMMSALASDASGAVTGVFDRSNVDLTRSGLYLFQSADGVRFTRPRRLLVPSTAPLVASPSLVANGGRTSLYFASAPSLQVPPTVNRISFEGGTLGAVETLPAVAGIDWLLSWPTFSALAGGGVALAFRDGAALPRFSVSTDGKTFAAPRAAVQTGAAMVGSAQANDGTIAVSYQVTTATEPMVSFVVFSRDGGTSWTAPIRIAPESNVHDTTMLARADGGLDLYYIYPPDAHGFSLFRRSLSTTGVLGPEQRLTASETGEPSKPKALRTRDGSVLVAWADIAERGASGEPVVQQMVLAKLGGDAPR